MNKDERLEAITAALKSAFPDAVIKVTDESAQHVGHAGAASGAGHFAVSVESSVFMNQPLIKRHQMVYAALAHMMGSDIHALRLDTRTP